MACANHPNNEATGKCSICGKLLCSECTNIVGSNVICSECLANRAVIAVPPERPVQQAISSSSLGLISLLIACLGVLGCTCGGSIGGFLLGIPAIILGYLARRQAGNFETQDATLGLVGLILGALETLFSILIIILSGSLFLFNLFLESPGNGRLGKIKRSRHLHQR